MSDMEATVHQRAASGSIANLAGDFENSATSFRSPVFVQHPPNTNLENRFTMNTTLEITARPLTRSSSSLNAKVGRSRPAPTRRPSLVRYGGSRVEHTPYEGLYIATFLATTLVACVAIMLR